MELFEIDIKKHEMSPEESIKLKESVKAKVAKNRLAREKARKDVAKNLGLTLEELKSIL